MNDLLDLSSLESRDNIQKDEVLVQEISEHAIRGLNQKIKEKGHTVEIQAKITTVQADRSRLEQVLVNILDNAIKYTPENGKILINWVKDGKWVALKVTDNGPGIPHEHHARLFERFYRVDKARSREQGGTGLGLAIVKHIMQGHGGTVAVESELGKGSTFICRFPFHD
jgi:two-component system phosphate regulon sensor histidine kinase PhoR